MTLHRTDPDIITVSGLSIQRGIRVRTPLMTERLFDYSEVDVPVEIIRGKTPGPVLFVTGAVHGDEINGTETVRRLLASRKALSHIRGTLIAVPVVNVFGFNALARYMPDRRDLNRCFPGNPDGSLGARLAYTLLTEIVKQCTHGIDLHTGAIHRPNLPQIRADMANDNEIRRLADAFGAPVALNSPERDGSLRKTASAFGVKTLLFEGGEALRYNNAAIKTALDGIFGVMRAIGMLPDCEETRPSDHKKKKVFFAEDAYWVRAGAGGSLRASKKPGATVKKGELLGVISDTFGGNRSEVRAEKEGVIIGMRLLPLVNAGDALFNIATFDAAEHGDDFLEHYDDLYSPPAAAG